jgi:exodeoxyribonuclease V alpha subunit
MMGHPVFIAQHATATCCRGCILKWHRIEKDRALNDVEMEFIVALIMGWIGGQINEKRGSAV